MINKIIPDTSVIIDGKISELLKEGELKNVEIVIPIAVLDELQAQASKGRETGFIGLEELKNLRKICEEMNIKMRFTGDRPTLEDIQLAKAGRLDAIIRDVAKHEAGELVTADFVQALVAEAEGVKVRHYAAKIKTTGLEFEKFFTEDTISVHLKEGVVPMAKRGKPGDFKLIKIGTEKLDRKQIENIIREMSDATRITPEGAVEISMHGALVLQLGNYRIAIARPPFSDGLEVTIVRPIIKLKLEDYNLSEKLMQRLSERAEGILISGPPGSGKSTLASGLAEFYEKKGKIVKTLESPRDLQVGPEITQYAPLEGKFEKTADILLLVRPDYSIFDEIRKPDDFRVFADLRMAGVGMIGVIHASEAIDAIQRFIGKVEMGIIPHVIDTIIFVEGGKVTKVYDLSMSVKVPSGMSEADLARPIVEVKDFETGATEYEIYTFGEENVVIPVQAAAAESGVRKLASERIMQEIRKFDPRAEVEITADNRATIRVDNEKVGMIIGKEGVNVCKLEGQLGIHIDVEPKVVALGKDVNFRLDESGNSVELKFGSNLIGKNASIYIGDEFLFSAIIGKNGMIKLTKKSDVGKSIVRAIVGRKRLRVLV